MTHRPDVACSRELAARWCALAERRLDHLTELFDSGRWRRYYTEQSLLDDIRQAKAAVQTWKGLSEPEAVSIVPSQTPPAIVAVQPASVRRAEPQAIVHRPIELPRSLETILAGSEIIVEAEIELVEDDREPADLMESDDMAEDDVAPEPAAAPPRIDMAALAQALSIGIDAGAEYDEPAVDLDAIERRYPALAVAY
ncbi:TIGR03809 family protein [Bradyrhizobium sp. HKCCYLS3013]|uniref:TIGR03809 family protein n=1 Tax=Bradyrhizobium sp. HKCCYLS3013 TaxID=3420735 RepID=UPI003EBD9262